MNLNFKGDLFKDVEDTMIVVGNIKNDLIKLKSLVDNIYNQLKPLFDAVGLESPDEIRKDDYKNNNYYFCFDMVEIDIEKLHSCGLFEKYSTKFKWEQYEEPLKQSNEIVEWWENLPYNK